MDIDVAIDADDPGTWDLRDLLGRSMGCIVETDGTFTILPEGNASQTMADLKKGPYGSLDDALAEIERHTRGVCRRAF